MIYSNEIDYRFGAPEVDFFGQIILILFLLEHTHQLSSL